MGVRFACHACGKRLNIKTELAGRRGICPACSVRFRIPAYDTEFSTPVQSEQPMTTAGDDGRNVGVSSTSAAIADRPKLRVVQSIQSAESRPSLDETLGGMSATWYVRPPTGGQFGPADGPTMGQWMKEGRVAQSAMVWRDGWTDWKLASDVIPGVSANGPELQNGSRDQSLASDHSLESNGSDPNTNQRGDSEQVIRANRGALGSNKKKRSKNRVVASVFLGLIFMSLLVALAVVVQRS